MGLGRVHVKYTTTTTATSDGDDWFSDSLEKKQRFSINEHFKAALHEEG